MNATIKKCLPHFAAIVLFVVLTLIYFYPIVAEDRELYQGDLQNMVGWGKDLKDYHKETGDYAFWSNSMFSGMPANYSYMPPMTNVFKIFEKAVLSVLPFNLGFFFLYMIGFYIFLIAIGCKPWLSIVGAIAYAFASYNIIIIEVGHVNKALVMSTMAPVIGGIILCYRKKYLWGAIVTLIFTGLNVLWQHQQISYYLLLTILILAVVYLRYAIKEKTLKDYFKSSALLLVIAVFAIAPELGNLIATADYTKDSMRGGAVLQSNAEGKKGNSGLDIDYAFGWSFEKSETMTLLIPNFFGASSHYNVGTDSEYYNRLIKERVSPKQAEQICRYAPMFWGEKGSTSGPPYAGAIVCFLFVLGLIIVKGPEKWWMLGATILSFVLAWGKHFETVNSFFFYHLPLYNKFRTVETALVIAGVTMAALAMLALKEIFDNANRKVYLKPVYIAAGITGGLCLVFALFGSAIMSFSGVVDAQIQSQQGPEMLAAIVSDRKSMLSSDSWRSFFFILLATGALWFYLRNFIKINYVVAVVGILIFIDLWTVDKRFLNFDSFVPKQKALVASEVDRQILQDKDPNYRVMNFAPGAMFNESRTSYFHKSIGGYSPAKLRRYQDIIDKYFSRGIDRNVMNMLNTKYVIMQNEQRQQVAQLNPDALGNVWFVNELMWVDTPDEEIAALKGLDPALTAVIDKEWQGTLTGWDALRHEGTDTTALIRLADYANPGNIFYESSSATPRLAVFSEVYYKTWHAYIDGVEAPLVRVNYILRGLPVPAGTHAIELKCVDDVYLRGAKISKIASVLVGIVLLGLLGYAIWISTVVVREKNVRRNKQVSS